MKIASKPPVRCSGCFLQHPDRVHVDLEAVYDGPVIPGSRPVQIDDNVLCENCVTNAAKLIGLTRDEELKARIDELTRLVQAHGDRATAAEGTVETLRAALAALEEFDAQVRPGAAPGPADAPASPQSSALPAPDPRDHSGDRGETPAAQAPGAAPPAEEKPEPVKPRPRKRQG